MNKLFPENHAVNLVSKIEKDFEEAIKPLREIQRELNGTFEEGDNDKLEALCAAYFCLKTILEPLRQGIDSMPDMEAAFEAARSLVSASG